MSLIVWILLGFVVGLAASKTVSTTGEGTVVDILLGIVGAVIGGWIFDSAGVATVGAIVVVVLYHVFLRHRML